MFLESSDMSSSPPASTAVEQHKESPGLWTTSLFHRCIQDYFSLPLWHSHGLIFTSDTFYSSREILGSLGAAVI